MGRIHSGNECGDLQEKQSASYIENPVNLNTVHIDENPVPSACSVELRTRMFVCGIYVFDRDPEQGQRVWINDYDLYPLDRLHKIH